ncbi:ferredoxin--NADP reductase [Psychrobacter lutiphocae]|uniref:ferredoxin--NADP reductase n=1 Tax=Psychrobacter lutiphocae TaxID=540500 RepID=UPI00037B83ED|nr:ferredoxin--NADP reductase [Psychrobacter lutiphocae]
MSDNIQPVKVLSKTTWTPNLFSFTVTRPDSFKFSAGQFVRLGVNPSRLAYHQQKRSTDVPDEDIFRAYSIVSSPYDETLEFFSIVIKDGAFTSQLQHLQEGDELLLNTTPFGFLTLARYQEPVAKDLWLLATGTGLAPFLSMLQDLKTWEDYEHIILAYSARSEKELAYLDLIHSLEETFGSLVESPAKFTFVPIVTREKVEGALNARFPQLLISGELEDFAGAKLDPEHSHVMLCGNPQMVEDTRNTLRDEKGMVMNRRGVGNIAVENYW